MIVSKTWEGPSPFKQWYAEFSCDCGHTDVVLLPGNPVIVQWDTSKERMCPKCKSFGKADKKKQLLVKKDLYEKELKKIREEIEKITKQEEVVHG